MPTNTNDSDDTNACEQDVPTEGNQCRYNGCAKCWDMECESVTKAEYV